MNTENLEQLAKAKGIRQREAADKFATEVTESFYDGVRGMAPGSITRAHAKPAVDRARRLEAKEQTDDLSNLYELWPSLDDETKGKILGLAGIRATETEGDQGEQVAVFSADNPFDHDHRRGEEVEPIFTSENCDGDSKFRAVANQWYLIPQPIRHWIMNFAKG